MRVFISWSGETSHKVADILYEWLRMIKIPTLEPYISDEMEKGEVWFVELRNALKSADCGILCVTEENADAPWLLFEAGALLTAKRRSFVSPFLFHVSPSRLSAPLTHLQSTVFAKSNVKGLIRKLNRSCGKYGLSKSDFDNMFENMYPALEQEILKIPVPDSQRAEPRQQRKSELPENIFQLLREYFLTTNGNMESRIDSDGETFKDRDD